MLQRIYQLRRYRSYLNPLMSSPFEAHEALEDTHEAKRLHASTYLVRGYVAGHEIDPDGFISLQADPYGAHARYFSVVRTSPEGKREVVAAARLIEAHLDLGYDSFQTWREQDLTPDAKARISAFFPDECAEVSALVKSSGVSTQAVLLLYRALWQYSLINGQKLWIMSCDESLLKRLMWLFGPAIQSIGEPVYFKGHTIVPIIINIPQSLGEIMRQRKGPLMARGLRRDVARFFLHALPSEVLSPSQRSLAQNLKAHIV
jgi:N-acyl-L-homoserine lactone synthetase